MVQKRKSIVAFLQERVYDMLCKVSRFGVNFMSYQGRSLCAAAAVPPFCLDFLGQFADILGTARVPEMAICHPRGAEKYGKFFPEERFAPWRGRTLQAGGDVGCVCR